MTIADAAARVLGGEGYGGGRGRPIGMGHTPSHSPGTGEGDREDIAAGVARRRPRVEVPHLRGLDDGVGVQCSEQDGQGRGGGEQGQSRQVSEVRPPLLSSADIGIRFPMSPIE